jgi:hypothetical protein
MDDNDLSEAEKRDRQLLIELCKEIAESYSDDEEC